MNYLLDEESNENHSSFLDFSIQFQISSTWVKLLGQRRKVMSSSICMERSRTTDPLDLDHILKMETEIYTQVSRKLLEIIPNTKDTRSFSFRFSFFCAERDELELFPPYILFKRVTGNSEHLIINMTSNGSRLEFQSHNSFTKVRMALNLNVKF